MSSEKHYILQKYWTVAIEVILHLLLYFYLVHSRRGVRSWGVGKSLSENTGQTRAVVENTTWRSSGTITLPTESFIHIWRQTPLFSLFCYSLCAVCIACLFVKILGCRFYGSKFTLRVFFSRCIERISANRFQVFDD